MAIGSVYSRVLERELAKGVGMEKAHNTATKEAETAQKIVTPDKPKRPDVVLYKAKPEIAKPTPLDDAYKQYVKRVKGIGGTKIATPEEYAVIKRRLAGIQQPSEKKKSQIGGNYAEYARRTAQPELRGASGADLEEVKKVLYGK